MTTGPVAKVKRKVRQTVAATGGKQVKLRLMHIDFWSAVRVGFVIQIALGIATLVGSFALWIVMSITGLFGSLSSMVTGIVGGDTVNVGDTLSLPRLMSFAIALAVFNIITGTLLSGIGAIVFNVVSRITGGVLVGFSNTSNN